MSNAVPLGKVKMALRITTDAFDEELTDLIKAALLDMGIAGVTASDTTDALVLRAVITYCKLHFGQPDDYDRLKRSYDEQKAQMATATNYTDWGDGNG
jgi:phage tail sheath gpL-like